MHTRINLVSILCPRVHATSPYFLETKIKGKKNLVIVKNVMYIHSDGYWPMFAEKGQPESQKSNPEPQI